MQPRRARILVMFLFAVFPGLATTTLTQQRNPSEGSDAGRMVLKVTTHLVMVDAVIPVDLNGEAS